MKRIAAAALGLSMVFGGCYTLLKHPRVQDENSAIFAGAHESEAISPSEDCMRCHDSGHEYYNPTLPYGEYYRGRSRAWLFYYDTPWWTDPYYYGGAVAAKDTLLPRPRDFGRRRQGEAAQPAQGGAASAHSSPAARAKTAGGSSAQASPAENTKKPEKRAERRATSSNAKKKSRRVKKQKN